MSHELTDTDAMFSVREMPWHGLGAVLPEHPTRAEAQPLVHGWEPIAEPIFAATPQVIDGEPTIAYEEVSGFKRMVRSDNATTLGVVTDTYVPVSNDEMWDVAEALEESASDIKYETGGSLRGGKDVWLMLRLQDPIQIKGDPNGTVLPFYLLQNKHDASGSFKGSATHVRVVCANTMRGADLDAQARGTEFSFRHSKNIKGRIEDARTALAGWRESVEEFQAFSEFLIRQTVDQGQVQHFLERYISLPPNGKYSDRVLNNVMAARTEWLEVYRSQTLEGITGTAYGLVQASSEWSEHIQHARTQETRFQRAYLGKNEGITRAMRLTRELVGV